MRSLLKRLEDIERATTPTRTERINVIRQIISAKDGKALPFDPKGARCRYGPPAPLPRKTGEALVEFEARALAHFDGDPITVY